MTKANSAEEQKKIEDIKEHVREVADHSRTVAEFLSATREEVPEISRIFPTTQSPSGGTGFTAYINLNLLAQAGAHKQASFSMMKKFPP